MPGPSCQPTSQPSSKLSSLPTGQNSGHPSSQPETLKKNHPSSPVSPPKTQKKKMKKPPRQSPSIDDMLGRIHQDFSTYGITDFDKEIALGEGTSETDKKRKFSDMSSDSSTDEISILESVINNDGTVQARLFRAIEATSYYIPIFAANFSYLLKEVQPEILLNSYNQIYNSEFVLPEKKRQSVFGSKQKISGDRLHNAKLSIELWAGKSFDNLLHFALYVNANDWLWSSDSEVPSPELDTKKEWSRCSDKILYREIALAFEKERKSHMNEDARKRKEFEAFVKRYLHRS